MPIFKRRTLIGFLSLTNILTQREWSQSQIAVLKILAEITANLLERKEMENVLRGSEELRRRAMGDLKNSEETARALRNAPSERLLLTDTGGKILDLNEIAAKGQGKSRAELIGMNIANLLPPSVVKTRKFYRDQVARTGKPVRFEDEREGSRFYITYYPISGPSGNVDRIAVFARDITERKQLEDRLRQSEKMEAVGTLAGGIAHDFNNILAAINGYSELGLSTDSLTDTEKHDLCTQILKAGDRAKELVKQILAFSRQAEQNSRR